MADQRHVLDRLHPHHADQVARVLPARERDAAGDLVPMEQQDRTAWDHELIDEGHTSLALDLSDVGFVDSSRLGVLVAIHRHAEARGGEFVVRSPPPQVRRLFDAFSRKGGILHLLDRCLDSEGIQLFIGEESGYRLLEELSLVTGTWDALAILGEEAGFYGRGLVLALGIGFLFALVGNIVTWSIGANRVAATAAKEGLLPPFLGRLHRRFNTLQVMAQSLVHWAGLLAVPPALVAARTGDRRLGLAAGGVGGEGAGVRHEGGVRPARPVARRAARDLRRDLDPCARRRQHTTPDRSEETGTDEAFGHPRQHVARIGCRRGGAGVVLRGRRGRS